VARQLRRRLRQPRSSRILILLSGFGALLCAPSPCQGAFDYSECLFGPARTLAVSVTRTDREGGTVECGGCDTAQGGEPFTWEWGDGEQTTGFFPQTHAYKDRRSNYIVKVTAYRPDGTSETAEALACFVPFSEPLAATKPQGDSSVVIPAEVPRLRASRAPYDVPAGLSVFDGSFFEACTRQTVEHVLTAAAAIQADLANDDVCKTNGRFDQVLLRDPECGGMYSLWYTDPVCLVSGDYGFKGHIEWSSLFHEMGHNVTLNSPADFRWGLKQDGPANTIYSETLAQIFQHATAYEMVNNRDTYGISGDLAFDIGQSALASMGIVRRAYEEYRKNGCRFCSWNDDKTEQDETVNTFMTVAYKFFEHAEEDQRGYRRPVKRLMAFFQRFNPEWEKAFSARNNSPEAEQFRATLACAAVSYAFGEDLREEFRELRFPVDDRVFGQLLPSGPAGENGTAEQGADADADGPPS
jgi:hypothetical protein